MNNLGSRSIASLNNRFQLSISRRSAKKIKTLVLKEAQPVVETVPYREHSCDDNNNNITSVWGECSDKPVTIMISQKQSNKLKLVQLLK